MSADKPMRGRSFAKIATGVFTAALALGHRVCSAETLFDAIALAYQTNPALRAQRADLRATDETYVQAKAGLGPQINFSGQYAYTGATVQDVSPQTASSTQANTGAVDLSAVQPLYTAGATRARIRGAADTVLAGREQLRQAESQLLQNVITAYVDVRRDRETLRILKDEIVALTKDFAEIKAKGALGVLTKTDVAQAEARLLSAEAQSNLAFGRLNASNAEYLNSVGQNPGELEPEPDLSGMPITVDEAFEAADHNNPQLLAAIQTEQAARETVNEAKAANGPNISLKLDGNISPYAPYLKDQFDQSVSASILVSKPLFTSGLNRSKVREALEQDNRARLNIETLRRDVVQTVAQAWDQLAATRSAMDIEQRQLRVELVAVDGNRVEERVGQRSTIDLLNAELELADARISFVQSRHDEYVARAALLAAMGLLETRFLTPTATAYDPSAKLKSVERIGATPMEPISSMIDSIAEPQTPAPRVSAPNAGAERPSGAPPLPKLEP